ncbi:MAG: glycosyltransferase family 4 protein [Candidatus Hodarchaeales archaeon]|jgi:glycosyltransferase involved in cell wall biosynthesis
MKVTMFYDLGPLDDFTITGGLESHILSLLKEFSSRGLSCNYVTGVIPFAKKSISRDGVKLIRINFPGMGQSWNPYNLKFKRQFLFLASASLRSRDEVFKDTDIFHGHVYSGGLAALITARIHKKKAVNTIHGSYFDHWYQITKREETATAFRIGEKILSRRLASACDLQIHTDRYFANKVKSFGGPVEKIITIHNGVDENIFNPDVEPSSQLLKLLQRKPRPLIITIRRLVPKNGVIDLINACYILASKIEFTLVICGDGPQRSFLETKVKQLGIHNNVIFLGRMANSEVPGLLRTADLVVVPSIVEASSISLIEAKLVKIPCVATKIPGISEITDDSMVQFSEAMNPISLAKGILRTIEKNNLTKRRVEKAFRFAKKHLTINVCVKKHLKAYERIL